jgi:ADP-ribose pyrophosphatase YjhB (NUDIX family)
MEARAKLVADVALFAGDQVLLVKYEDTSRYDGQKGWFLPDDYLGYVEHPSDAATRVVREQTGLEPDDLALADVESFGNGAWHLIFHFRGSLPEATRPENGDNVAAAEWFPLEALPRAEEVAHHGWALETIAKISG